MAKKQIEDIVPVFAIGDIVSITKSVNGKNTGIGEVVSCTDKIAVVRFDKGHLACSEIKVPVHALEVIQTAKRIAKLKKRTEAK